MKRALRLTLMAVVVAGCLFGNDSPAPTTSWTSQAGAIIGRPLTPLSYAGVARRTTRRYAYAGAAAYGAAVAPPAYGYAVAPPPVYAAPACAYDVYGQMVCR